MFSNNPGLGSWPPQSSPAHAGSRPADDIYIMPERFHARQHQSSNKTLLIAAAVLFLTAAAAAAYFGYEFWRGYQPTLISQNQPVVNNQLANNISRQSFQMRKALPRRSCRPRALPLLTH